MRELPKNPNVRQPYSDVSLELEYYLGDVVQWIGVKLDDRQTLERKLKCLDQALLRVRAILDPETLTEEEWEKTKKTAYDLEEELR